MSVSYPFSPSLGANLCLSDKKRVNAFERAIKETVNQGDIILDIGSGTGILAFLALKYGARKAYAVEIDTYLSKRIQKIAEENGFASQIEVINKDILEVNSIDENIDIVLMEMLSTGLIEEPQVPAYNHLIKKEIIVPSTRIIPQTYHTSCIPLEYDFSEYSFYMPRAKDTTDILRKKLAAKKPLSTIEFDGTGKNPEVKTSMKYTIGKDGIFNAVGLMSYAKLSKKVFLGESTWINNSVVIPLDRCLYVRRNNRIRVNINYQMGYGFSTFKLGASLLKSH